VDRVVSADDYEVGSELSEAAYDGTLVFVVDNTNARFLDKEVSFKIRDMRTDKVLYPDNTPTTSSSTTTAMLSKGYISYLFSGDVFEKEGKDGGFKIRVANGRKVTFLVNVKEGSRIKFRASVNRKDVKLTVVYQMDVAKTLIALRDASNILQDKTQIKLKDLRSELETFREKNKDLESSLIEHKARDKNEIKMRKDEIERLNNVICEMAEKQKKRKEEHENVTKGLKKMLEKIQEKHADHISELSLKHAKVVLEKDSKLETIVSKVSEESRDTLLEVSKNHKVSLERLKQDKNQEIEKLRQDHELRTRELESNVKDLSEKLSKVLEERKNDLVQVSKDHKTCKTRERS